MAMDSLCLVCFGYVAFFIVPLLGFEFWTEKRRDLNGAHECPLGMADGALRLHYSAHALLPATQFQ